MKKCENDAVLTEGHLIRVRSNLQGLATLKTLYFQIVPSIENRGILRRQNNAEQDLKSDEENPPAIVFSNGRLIKALKYNVSC